MYINFLLAIVLSIFILILYVMNSKKRRREKSNLLIRFRQKINSKKHIKERTLSSNSNHLMASPDKNITINSWEEEYELREKADIHRSRLSKFGRSKINGEMLFLGEKGRVYKYAKDGAKKYI